MKLNRTRTLVVAGVVLALAVALTATLAASGHTARHQRRSDLSILYKRTGAKAAAIGPPGGAVAVTQSGHQVSVYLDKQGEVCMRDVTAGEIHGACGEEAAVEREGAVMNTLSTSGSPGAAIALVPDGIANVQVTEHGEARQVAVKNNVAILVGGDATAIALPLAAGTRSVSLNPNPSPTP